MCNLCDNDVNSGKLAMAALVAVLAFFVILMCAGTSSGAEVKAVPLAQINQTESPVIAKGLGIGRPEAHDIPKFELPPAGEVAAVAGVGFAAVLLIVAQLAGIAITTIVVVVVGVWAFRKFFGAKSVPALIAGLDKLVDSHRANFSLAKAIHARLGKIMVIEPAVTPPVKKPRKKKVNVAEKSA